MKNCKLWCENESKGFEWKMKLGHKFIIAYLDKIKEMLLFHFPFPLSNSKGDLKSFICTIFTKKFGVPFFNSQ